MANISDKVTYLVIDTLNRRGGFDSWWDSIDAEIRDEIREELSQAIDEELSLWMN